VILSKVKKLSLPHSSEAKTSSEYLSQKSCNEEDIFDNKEKDKPKKPNFKIYKSEYKFINNNPTPKIMINSVDERSKPYNYWT